MTNMKVMSMLFARWKGVKIKTEHLMHVLRTYRVSGIAPYKWEPLWHVVVVLTILFGMNKHFFISELNIFAMYCSHSLHIFFF